MPSARLVRLPAVTVRVEDEAAVGIAHERAVDLDALKSIMPTERVAERLTLRTQVSTVTSR